MSRAACRSTSRRAYATGYALALLVRSSSPTRLSLAKAEREIIGRKAVRLLIAVVVFAAHVRTATAQSTPMVRCMMLILRGRFVNPSFQSLQALNSWIPSW
jgi:hypothetical protein